MSENILYCVGNPPLWEMKPIFALQCIFGPLGGHIDTKFGLEAQNLSISLKRDINIFSKKHTGVQKQATFSDFSTTKGGFPIYFVTSRIIYLVTLTFPSVKSQPLMLKRSLSTFWKPETYGNNIYSTDCAKLYSTLSVHIHNKSIQNTPSQVYYALMEIIGKHIPNQAYLKIFLM